MNEKYQLVSLEGASDALLAQVHQLYLDSFPPEDRVPFNNLLTSITNSWDDFERFFWSFSSEGRVLGMCYFLYDGFENLAYLEYIAIDPNVRGRGHGQWLMNQIFTKLDERGQAKGNPGVDWVVWEVQAPSYLTQVEERRIAERRIAFYQKFGARKFPVSFRYPPIQPGMPEVEYLLMARSSPPGRRMTEKRVRRMMDFCLLKINRFSIDGPHYLDAAARLEHWYKTH